MNNELPFQLADRLFDELERQHAPPLELEEPFSLISWTTREWAAALGRVEPGPLRFIVLHRQLDLDELSSLVDVVFVWRSPRFDAAEVRASGIVEHQPETTMNAPDWIEFATAASPLRTLRASTVSEILRNLSYPE